MLFDVGHGAGSFSWQTCETALAQEFLPDTISTDLHTQNVRGPVYDLATTVSKFLLLGLDLLLGRHQALQLLAERLDLLCTRPAQVVVVDHHATDGSRVLLVQQYLDPLLATHRIGRAHLAGEHLALSGQGLGLNRALRAQLFQTPLLFAEPAIQRAHPARKATNGLLRFLELTGQRGLFATACIHLRPQAFDARAQRLELCALCLSARRGFAGAERRGAKTENEHEDQRHKRDKGSGDPRIAAGRPIG